MQNAFLGNIPTAYYDHLESSYSRVVLNHGAEVKKIKPPVNGILTRESLSVASIANVTDVYIGTGITKIDDGCFSQASSLSAVNFLEGNNCSAIGESAFYYCQKLKSISFPDSMRVIQENAFAYSMLSSISLNKGLREIQISAFGALKTTGNLGFCYNSVHVPSLSDWLVINMQEPLLEVSSFWSSPLFFTGNGFNGITFDSGILSGEVVIPDFVNNLQTCEFIDCSQITKIVLPPAITYIPSFWCKGCTSLSCIDVSRHIEPVRISNLYQTKGSAFWPFNSAGSNIIVLVRDEHMKSKFLATDSSWSNSQFTLSCAN